MPDPRSIVKWLQYAPLAYELVKNIMPSSATVQQQADETREALAVFQRSVANRIADLEEENTRLRTRIRETESLVMSLQLWLWIGGGVLTALVLILLITVIVTLSRG